MQVEFPNDIIEYESVYGPENLPFIMTASPFLTIFPSRTLSVRPRNFEKLGSVWDNSSITWAYF